MVAGYTPYIKKPKPTPEPAPVPEPVAPAAPVAPEPVVEPVPHQGKRKKRGG